MKAEPPRSLWRLFQPLLLLLAALATLISPALASRALAQSTQEKTEQTRYFTIIYPEGEEASADWYAGFIDDVDDAVSEMLGSDPLTWLTLHIYSTEADYIIANPIAGEHAGIMAHAIPGKLEIGVAVERLRQVEPEVARASFRHEMTHMVAGELSDQNLPIGFQEGLAQYNELSTSRAQASAQYLRNAQDHGVTFLSLTELNDRWRFTQVPELAYPEAYSMMAFFADRYGMDYFGRYLATLKGGEDWSSALFEVYGYSARSLDREWRNWLPTFLAGGWQTNLLTYYDLSPGIALFDGGKFDEAADHFEHSQQLYNQLGRADRAATAGDYLDKSQRASLAQAQATSARTALEAYDYRTAYGNAQSAWNTFSSLALDSHAQSVDQTLQLAQKGLGAVQLMDSALAKAGTLDLPGARTDARAAGEVFAQLGDTARANQAAEMVAEWSRYSVFMGVAVLIAGLGVVAAGVLITMRRRLQTAPSTGRASAQGTAQASLITRKESADWL